MSSIPINLATHIDKLGKRVKDRITGFTGVCVSINFDLYGCIQATINPGVDADGKPKDCHWFDIARVEVIDETLVMPRPKFEWFKDPEVVSAGEQGCSERPAGRMKV